MSEHSDTVRHCVERNNAGTIDPDDVTNLCNAALRLDEECERLHDGLEHCTKNSGEDSCAAILLENERLRAELCEAHTVKNDQKTELDRMTLRIAALQREAALLQTALHQQSGWTSN